jgi:hypothetical protein
LMCESAEFNPAVAADLLHASIIPYEHARLRRPRHELALPNWPLASWWGWRQCQWRRLSTSSLAPAHAYNQLTCFGLSSRGLDEGFS